MAAFKTLILVINIFSSISVVCLVLMQQGKGADAGAGFGGSGSAQGVFGSAGNANFLSRMTALFATIFFVSSLALSYVHSGNRNKGIDFSNVQQTASVAASAPASSVSVASQPALPQQNRSRCYVSKCNICQPDRSGKCNGCARSRQCGSSQRACQTSQRTHC